MPLTESQAEYLEGLTQLAASEAEQADWLERWLAISAKGRSVRREDHTRDSKSATV